MKKAISILLMLLFCHLEGGYVLKEGRLVDADLVAYTTSNEHLHFGLAALQRRDWDEAIHQFRILIENFSYTPQGQDAYYFLGFAYYKIEEFDFANEAFSSYLKNHNTPQYFEEALSYKFNIANHFRNGAKKRFFGWKQLPKWAPAGNLAIDIYDEVIAAVPCHELAAQSLYAKAQILWEDRMYRDSIEVYQQLIRRFPKHELAPQSYLEISQIYMEQNALEANNPDILALAQINLKRFQHDFPRHELFLQAQEDFNNLRERYAYALLETGKLYERKGHPKASVLYYKRAIDQFPDTQTAEICHRRLFVLSKIVEGTEGT